jgi:hypothetical protein
MSYKEASASFAHFMQRRVNGTVSTPIRRRIAMGIIVVIVFATSSAIADFYLPNLFPFLNSTGFSASYSNAGRINLSGAFFQSLGTNGRSCGTCHQPSDGFGLSPGQRSAALSANAWQRPLVCTGRRWNMPDRAAE